MAGEAVILQVLGDHVDQKGSIVQPDRLRFDFSHSGPIDGPTLGQIENICNQQLAQKMKIYAKDCALSDARRINGRLLGIYGLLTMISSAKTPPGIQAIGFAHSCNALANVQCADLQALKMNVRQSKAFPRVLTVQICNCRAACCLWRAISRPCKGCIYREARG